MKDLRIFETQDGSHSIFAEQFGVSYHSKYGAIQETEHVFMDAALRFKAVLQKKIHVLGMGFGTGLNAYMTYLEARKRKLDIHYTAVEAYPISPEQWQKLNYEAELQVENKEQGIFELLHNSPWNAKQIVNENFSLLKLQTKFEDLQLEQQFDIIYYDTFAPNAQPELWTQKIFKMMYDTLLPNGILVTYCAKGEVKRNMKSVGFDVERLQGPPGKREMTRAIRK